MYSLWRILYETYEQVGNGWNPLAFITCKLNLKEQIRKRDFESKTGLSTSLSKGHSHPIDACPVHQSLSLKPTGLCVVFWSDERRCVSSKKGQSVVPFRPIEAREVSLWKLKAATKVKLITLEALEYTQVVMWCGCNIMHTYVSYRRSSAYCLPSSNFTRNVCQQSLTVSLATKKGGHGTLAPWRFGWNTSFFYFFCKTCCVVFFLQPMLLLNHRTATVPFERLKGAIFCCGQDLNNQLI